MKQLAIVIPAYKIDFFRATLDSLAAQTCKDFTVYVGDDCSPSDFGSLIEEYKDRLDIRYTKFDTNLGGKDLVAQWTRCIDLTEGEPWLWLFSDDDVMGERCVEAFYKEIADGAKFDIYHFNVDVINEKGHIVNHPAQYPELISPKSFFKSKVRGTLECFVVEYVFTREIYNKVKGFEKFDLAWGSDSATWMKMGKYHGIKTIEGGVVKWRLSTSNITPMKDNEMSCRKLKISIDYISWAQEFFNRDKDVNRLNKEFLLRRLKYYSTNITIDDVREVMDYAKKKKVFSTFTCSLMLLVFPLLKFANRL